MLTIEQLDLIKRGYTEYLHQTHCLSCSNPAKLYLYISKESITDTATVYPECDYHLAQDRQKYRNLIMIKLSEKEIFYLKL